MYTITKKYFLYKIVGNVVKLTFENFNIFHIFKYNIMKIQNEQLHKKIPFWIDNKHTPHGVDVYPQSAAGAPFTAAYIACKGDAIANLQEDLAAEQKARATYEKLIDLCRDNPDVVDPLKFLREREVVHFQRFGEALRGVQDKLAEKKFYMNNMQFGNMNNNDCGCK